MRAGPYTEYMTTPTTSRGFGAIALIITIAVIAALGGGTYYVAQRSAQTKTTTENTSDTVATSSQNSVSATTSLQANVQTPTTGASVDASLTGNLSNPNDLGDFTDGKASLKALLTLGKNMNCTVTNSVPGAESTGTVFISGEKLRGTFTSTVNGAPVTSNVLRTGTTVHVWSGIQGAKMSYAASISGTPLPGSIDLSTKVQYTCDPWTPTEATFTIPSTVTFVDVSAMLQGGTSN